LRLANDIAPGGCARIRNQNDITSKHTGFEICRRQNGIWQNLYGGIEYPEGGSGT
jgi:hypothetical protein